MKGLEYTISVTDTDLFNDVLELLKKACDKDPGILEELTEIMNKHDDVFDYSVKNKEE